MADLKAPQMQATLGLTGTDDSNAMALIAPGAFLWLTFVIQAGTGTTAPTIVARHLCRLLYAWPPRSPMAEISKLYPGTAQATYYAEQALLSRTGSSSMPASPSSSSVGLASLLLGLSGVMVAVTGVFVGYIVGFLYPNFMSGSNPGLIFMALVRLLLILCCWTASKGARASTAVNLAINIVQISAAAGLQCTRNRLSYKPSYRVAGLPV